MMARTLTCIALALAVPATASLPAAKEPASPVLNPGFELDADHDGSPDGWGFIAGDGGKSALSLDKGRTGKHSAKVTCEVMQGRWGPGLGQAGTVAVEKGKYYRVVFNAKGEDVANLTVGLHDTSNWQHCGLWSTVTMKEDWHRHEVTFRAAKTCSETTRLQFGIGAEGKFWLDDVVFELSGPPRNEALLDVEGAKNLLPNASFELGESGWGTYGADKLFGEIDSTAAAHGKCSFKIALAPDRYPVYYNDFVYRQHGTPGHGPVTKLPLTNVGWVPLEKNQPYTLSLWLKTDKPGLAVSASVALWPSGAGSKTFNATGQWQRYAFTFKPRYDSGFVTIEARVDDPARDRATLWIDGVQLERGAAPTAFEPMRPVEMAAATPRPGNIFHLGDRVEVELTLRNSTDAAKRVSVHERITDFFDRPVHEASKSIDVPRGATVHRQVVPTQTDPGFYRLHLRLEGEGYKQEQRMRFAVIFPYAQTYPRADSQFGINHAFISDHFMGLARDAGVSWVRSWFLKWDDVEPVQGRFEFAESDVQLNRLLDLGFRVQVCLATPSCRWSSSAPADMAGTTGSEAELRRNWWLPKSFDDYERYVFGVVDQFKGRVRHWEVFNEPVDRKGGPDSNLDLKANYIKFLRCAGAAARRADPKCQVMGAGYHYISQAMEKQAALAHMDITSEHAYPGLATSRAWQRRWDELAGKFQAAGGPRPIWVTEYGVYADDDPDPTTAQSRFLVHLGKDSEREAATHVVQHYVIALASGVDKMFFHIGNWPWQLNREHGCGFHMFFEYAGLPRKTYVTHNVLAWMLTPRAKLSRRIHTGPRLFAYEFRAGDQATIVAWRARRATLGSGVRAVLCAQHVEVRDVAGRDVRRGLTQLGNSPVYFRCKQQDAGAIARALLELRER